MALTSIPGRRRTAGGVCDEERSERGIWVIRSLRPPKRKSTATHRTHASIHLAGRSSCPARLPLRDTRRLGSLLNANSVEQEFHHETPSHDNTGHGTGAHWH